MHLSLSCAAAISGRPTAQKAFYHMDWPYALPTQDPQQIQRQLVLSGGSVASKGKNAHASAAVACPSVDAADRRATSCLYMSIWRRLRAGQIKTAEALAAAKGASWLVHVLRGVLVFLCFLLRLSSATLVRVAVPGPQRLFSCIVTRTVGFCDRVVAGSGGEAWLETHGTEDFCLPGAGGLFSPEEIEFLSNASWILRVCYCGCCGFRESCCSLRCCCCFEMLSVGFAVSL